MTRSDGASFRRVLDTLGLRIASGEFPVGATGTIDDIAETYGISRSVAREVTRVFVSLGLLSSTTRIGLRVNPQSMWDFLDPQLIRWRLASEVRGEQMEDLRELRDLVEPAAARQAAEGRSRQDAEHLHEIVGDMDAAMRARDAAAYLDADERFHRLLLTCVGNRMVMRLSDLVDLALHERAPQPEDWRGRTLEHVELHRAVATAVADGDGMRAADQMRKIINTR